jgi:glycosyltransferase involved in cell wall biosynthesis
VDVGALRQKLHIASDVPVVLFVGALDRAHHFKGADRLLRAFGQLRDRRSTLLVVGEGDLRPGLERLASDLGVADRTRFVGKVSNTNLAPFYNAADVLVLPSVPPESFGLVLIEAMASGRPVVAHDIPGVRTLVRPGVDGYLAQPGDLADLVEKIDRLVDDPELRRRMGAEGRAKVEASYAWTRVGERLSRMYAEVLADG